MRVERGDVAFKLVKASKISLGWTPPLSSHLIFGGLIATLSTIGHGVTSSAREREGTAQRQEEAGGMTMQWIMCVVMR